MSERKKMTILRAWGTSRAARQLAYAICPELLRFDSDARAEISSPGLGVVWHVWLVARRNVRF